MDNGTRTIYVFQGGILSPVVFNYPVDDFRAICNELSVDSFAYADDLTFFNCFSSFQVKICLKLTKRLKMAQKKFQPSYLKDLFGVLFRA